MRLRLSRAAVSTEKYWDVMRDGTGPAVTALGEIYQLMEWGGGLFSEPPTPTPTPGYSPSTA